MATHRVQITFEVMHGHGHDGFGPLHVEAPPIEPSFLLGSLEVMRDPVTTVLAGEDFMDSVALPRYAFFLSARALALTICFCIVILLIWNVL